MKQAQIYFQSQGKFTNFCLMHSLNNLLGYAASSQKELNRLCKQLSNDFINPHKHFLGGDYDANVLILALQNLGYCTKWLDIREEENIYYDSMVLKDERVGYILNKQCETNWFKKNLGISDRHWIAVRCKEGIYYELDSKKEAKQMPVIQRIGQYLMNEIRLGSYIFEVLTENRMPEIK